MEVEFLNKFIDVFKRIPKLEPVHYWILIVTVLFLILLMIECGINYWIRSAITHNLAGESGLNFRISSKISWVGLNDILTGKVNQFSINARNCDLNGLRYSKIIIDSHGFRFNLPVLLKEKRLEIIGMEQTLINGEITEDALNQYLKSRYPVSNSRLEIKPGGIILYGSANILNSRVSLELEGDLKVIAPKKLRFYPTGFLLDGHKIAGTLLQVVNKQIPFEFEIMENWPLRILELTLNRKVIRIKMEDLT